jgi:hypothetical protein
MKLAPSTSAAVLAAAIAILFNTALAWAKDASPPLNSFMASLTGHHWTTHGLADLAVFVGLWLILARTKFAGKIDPTRLIGALVAAVAAAAFGLVLWFAFV